MIRGLIGDWKLIQKSLWIEKVFYQGVVLDMVLKHFISVYYILLRFITFHYKHFIIVYHILLLFITFHFLRLFHI